MKVAAQVLGISDLSLIYVQLTNTDVSTRATGGSSTSEAACASTKIACENLLAAMETGKQSLMARLGRPPS